MCSEWKLHVSVCEIFLREFHEHNQKFGCEVAQKNSYEFEDPFHILGSEFDIAKPPHHMYHQLVWLNKK